MPGSIRVLVLEAFDLPEAIADGEDVTIKVAMGTREFQTAPNKAYGGKTTPWSSDFVFPVLNLRDNLLVMLLNDNGKIISKSEIDTPSIVEKGSFEVDLVLNSGGNIHLSLSFVLTDEERRRIDIMRAAALKRREQKVLKTAANTQPVEQESEIGPTNPRSMSIGDLEKDIENFEGSKESPAVSDASEEPQPNESGENLQVFHQESSIGLEPVEELDSIGQDLSEKSSYGRSLSPINPPIDSQTLADQVSANSSSTTEMQPRASTFKEPESPEDSSEVNYVTPSRNGVKAKIKAYETSKQKGAMKQVSHTLPSTVEVHVSNPQFLGSPRRYTEIEAEKVESPKAHLDHMDVKCARDENIDPVNDMESGEPSERVSKSNVAASRAARAEHYQREKEETEIKGIESNKPTPSTHHVEASEKDMQREKSLAQASKQKRSVDLGDVSKQVLNGAIVGAISGAVLAAAGALFWARNPNKRTNRSARQLSKQELRK